MRPLLRNVAALAVLTLLAGAALAWFAQVTEDDAASNRLEAELRILRELVGAGDGSPRDARQHRPDGVLGDTDLVLCERGLVVLQGSGDGYGGRFRLVVALKLDGSIKGVRVLEHAETPGFGDILNTPSAWLDSFTTGDVHAVTGATITSDAVKAAVERAVQRARLEDMCVARGESATLHFPDRTVGATARPGGRVVVARLADIAATWTTGRDKPVPYDPLFPAHQRPGERVGEFAQRILGATAKRSRLAWNNRERARKRAGAIGPCEVGVVGPEANPAHSEAKCRAGFGALP